MNTIRFELFEQGVYMFVYKITFSFHVELVSFFKLGYQILERKVYKVRPSVRVTLIVAMVSLQIFRHIPRNILFRGHYQILISVYKCVIIKTLSHQPFSKYGQSHFFGHEGDDFRSCLITFGHFWSRKRPFKAI